MLFFLNSPAVNRFSDHNYSLPTKKIFKHHSSSDDFRPLPLLRSIPRLLFTKEDNATPLVGVPNGTSVTTKTVSGKEIHIGEKIIFQPEKLVKNPVNVAAGVQDKTNSATLSPRSLLMKMSEQTRKHHKRPITLPTQNYIGLRQMPSSPKAQHPNRFNLSNPSKLAATKTLKATPSTNQLMANYNPPKFIPIQPLTAIKYPSKVVKAPPPNPSASKAPPPKQSKLLAPINQQPKATPANHSPLQQQVRSFMNHLHLLQQQMTSPKQAAPPATPLNAARNLTSLSPTNKVRHRMQPIGPAVVRGGTNGGNVTKMFVNGIPVTKTVKRLNPGPPKLVSIQKPIGTPLQKKMLSNFNKLSVGRPTVLPAVPVKRGDNANVNTRKPLVVMRVGPQSPSDASKENNRRLSLRELNGIPEGPSDGGTSPKKLLKPDTVRYKGISINYVNNGGKLGTSE